MLVNIGPIFRLNIVTLAKKCKSNVEARFKKCWTKVPPSVGPMEIQH